MAKALGQHHKTCGPRPLRMGQKSVGMGVRVREDRQIGGSGMREILFRGRRVDNGEEVEGSLLQGKQADYDANGKYIGLKDCAIIVLSSGLLSMNLDYCGECAIPYDTANSFEVVPETIREFTGLTDRNGKKIFEGDILSITTTVKGDWVKDDNGNYKETTRIDYAVVQEDKNTCGYKLKVYHNGKYKRISKFTLTHIYRYYKAEVIGNVYDNPELLEEKK